ADLQHLTAHKSAQTSPAKQAKDYHGVGEVRAIHCDETQNDYQGRHGGNDLDQSLNGNIDPTAIVTGNSAQRNTDHKTDAHGHHADGERGSPAIEQACPDIAPN